MGEATVKFKKKEVLDFIDLLINFWRSHRDKYAEKENIDLKEVYKEGSFDNLPLEVLKGICYIDAYQSMRASLFGDILEEK
jgi:hypothetical protein